MASIPLPAASLQIGILDWNIDRGYDLDEIANSIRGQKPAIVTLQEVDLDAKRTGNRDVAKELAAKLGMHYAFGKAFQELNQSTPEHPAFQGQATLSRFPITTTRVLNFTHQTGFWKPEPYLPKWFPQRRLGGRVALITELDVDGKRVVVYNLHLESRGVLTTRLGELEEAIFDAKSYPPDVPIILTGDINAKYFPEQFAKKLKAAGFEDCFQGRRPRTHRVFFNLDWMYMRGALSCSDARVVHEVHGSDHYAIRAEAHLR